MDINGRYLGIWVLRDELAAILGFDPPDPPSPGQTFTVVGKVVGESPVGLWLTLEAVTMGVPPESVFPDLQKGKPRRLVRWEYVRAAELFDEKPDVERSLGFRG
jgi:hypothetical protein